MEKEDSVSRTRRVKKKKKTRPAPVATSSSQSYLRRRKAGRGRTRRSKIALAGKGLPTRTRRSKKDKSQSKEHKDRLKRVRKARLSLTQPNLQLPWHSKGGARGVRVSSKAKGSGMAKRTHNPFLAGLVGVDPGSSDKPQTKEEMKSILKKGSGRVSVADESGTLPRLHYSSIRFQDDTQVPGQLQSTESSKILQELSQARQQRMGGLRGMRQRFVSEEPYNIREMRRQKLASLRERTGAKDNPEDDHAHAADPSDAAESTAEKYRESMKLLKQARAQSAINKLRLKEPKSARGDQSSTSLRQMRGQLLAKLNSRRGRAMDDADAATLAEDDVSDSDESSMVIMSPDEEDVDPTNLPAEETKEEEESKSVDDESPELQPLSFQERLKQLRQVRNQGAAFQMKLPAAARSGGAGNLREMRMAKFKQLRSRKGATQPVKSINPAPVDRSPSRHKRGMSDSLVEVDPPTESQSKSVLSSLREKFAAPFKGFKS